MELDLPFLQKGNLTMKRSLLTGVVAGCLLTLALPVATTRAQEKAPASPKPAAPAKSAKTGSATLKCPACGMAMPTTKSASAPTPMKINGKVYYCCNGCPPGQKAAAYSKANKGAIMSVPTDKAAPKKSAPKKS
jgi:hypothetical protein